MNDQPPGSGHPPERRSSRHFVWFETLLSGLNSIGTLWIFLLMVVISIDVIGRTAFNAPLPGVLELVRLSIVGIVFIQLGHTLRAGYNGTVTIADGSTECYYDFKFIMGDRSETVVEEINICELGSYTIYD